jgi:hypothetical protein
VSCCQAAAVLLAMAIKQGASCSLHLCKPENERERDMGLGRQKEKKERRV